MGKMSVFCGVLVCTAQLVAGLGITTGMLVGSLSLQRLGPSRHPRARARAPWAQILICGI